MASIPCEFCDHLVPVDNYELHAARCYMMHLIRGDFDEDLTEPDEREEGPHSNVLEAYITSNRQLHRANLAEFLDAHHSPPEPSGVFMERYLRERMWRLPRRARGRDPSYGTYEANLELAERIGKVEIGVKNIDTVSSVVSCDGLDKSAVCAVCQRSFGEVMSEEGASSSSPTQQPIVRRLKCDHTFCGPCIEQWLSKNKTCPVCIAEFS